MVPLGSDAPIAGFGSTGDVEGLVVPQADSLKGSILSGGPAVGVKQHPVPTLRPAKEHLRGIQTIEVSAPGQLGPGQGHHGREDVQHT